MAKRDPARTRQRILKAGTRLFAKTGFDGTSVDSIVRSARVSKRMVYHYYGNKRGLYRAVFARQWVGLSEEVGKVFGEMDPAGGTASLLEDTVAALFDYMSGHPEFTRLMMWEGLEGGAVSRSIWGEISGPLFQRVEEFLKAMQKNGELDPRLKPGHLVISALGAVVHYFAYAGSLSDLIGKEPLSPEGMRERRAQLVILFRDIGKGDKSSGDK